MRLLALVILSGAGTLCASCAQPEKSDLSPLLDFAGGGGSAAERTGESQDPWTRADCQNAFVRNMHFCDTWTMTTRPACYGIMAGLHVACIKGAED